MDASTPREIFVFSRVWIISFMLLMSCEETSTHTMKTAMATNTSVLPLESTGPVNVRLILRDEDGSLHGLLRSFAAKWECQRDENMHAALRAVQCPELFSAPGSGGAEVRLLVSAELIRRHIVRLTPLEAVTAEENARIDLSQFPSITVLPGKEADLWALAKQYHSTVALIEAANRDLETSVLLIPRVR